MFIRFIPNTLWFSVCLTACGTTTGPVNIREANESVIVPVTEGQVLRDSVVQPVSPHPFKATTPIPLKSKLLLQSEKRLQAQDVEGAIALAERGLRIDRRDAYFYQLLAKAYRILGNQQQSIYFAKLGLRYAPKESKLYHSLMAYSVSP